MSIVRVRKRENPYVIMDKTGLEDERLSFKAKGLLAYLLGKPDNWSARISHLQKVGPDGETAVSSGLKELEKYGYLEKKPVRNADGTIKEWESIIYEIPTTSPERDFPVLDNPDMDNNGLIINDCNKELNNKKQRENARGKTEKIDNQIKNKYRQIFNKEMPDNFIAELIQKHSINKDLILKALECAETNAKYPSYLNKLLADWSENGIKTLSQADKYTENRNTNKSTYANRKANKSQNKANRANTKPKVDKMERQGWT